MNGNNPLDSSAVHPEAYPVVEKIATQSARDVRALIGDSAFLKGLNAADFTDTTFGLPTVTDIINELDKPGRDPRPDFKAAEFKEGIEDIRDLKLNMELEGVVTNVTNFGAFVDVGVHQDGLVHISALSDRFVKDPAEVVKTGDIVKVKVMEVDVARRRIGLSMRMSDKAEERVEARQQVRAEKPVARGKPQKTNKPGNRPRKKESAGTFADLFANAKQLRK